MNKVVFYTHRLAFIINWIIPLSKFLKYKIIIFHVNQLNNENFSFRSIPNGIEVYDISKLKYKSIIKLIKDINPKLFITLNFRSPYELFISKVFQSLKIKTIYLEHGLYTDNTVATNFFHNLKKIIKNSFFKNIVFWKRIIEFIINNKSKTRSFVLFFNALKKGNYTLFSFDKYYLLGEYSYIRLVKHFNLEKRRIVFSGYPLFETIKQNRNYFRKNNTEDANTILYIHQPFILDKLSKIDYEVEKNYINTLNNISENHNYKFKILLHPRENLEKYKSQYPDIEIIQHPNDIKVFEEIQYVIGHYSTALFFPLFLKKEIFIIDYPDVKCNSIFNTLGMYFNSISEFEVSLKIKSNNNNLNNKELSFYIGEKNSYEEIAILLNNE